MENPEGFSIFVLIKKQRFGTDRSEAETESPLTIEIIKKNPLFFFGFLRYNRSNNTEEGETIWDTVENVSTGHTSRARME